MKLGRLVSSLDAIYCALENPKQDFRNRFECDWGKLEDTNAIMLDQERMYLNEFDKELVQRALRDLEVLIASQLDSI